MQEGHLSAYDYMNTPFKELISNSEFSQKALEVCFRIMSMNTQELEALAVLLEEKN